LARYAQFADENRFCVTIAATVLTTTPFGTPASSQGGKMAQVDMQGRHFDDRDPSAFYSEHRRGYGAKSGVVPSGVTIGPQDHAQGTLRLKRRATKN
jgi:hypothetical protein